MYALFARLPRHLRRRLYDEYAALPVRPSDPYWRPHNGRGQPVCPAGYVNAHFDPGAVLLPERDQDLCPAFQNLVRPGDLERFVDDWDNRRVGRLDIAMGAKSET